MREWCCVSTKQCKGEESVRLCRTEERGRSMCWRKREWYRNIKDRGALWVSMSERGDDGVGVLKASSTAVCCSAQPPLTVQHTHITLILMCIVLMSSV